MAKRSLIRVAVAMALVAGWLGPSWIAAAADMRAGAMTAGAGLGLILCIIGVFFTGFIAYLIIAHLVAQISGMLGHSRPAVQDAPPAM
jgi:predicted lipid-binding transport protein (Tim44 family)